MCILFASKYEVSDIQNKIFILRQYVTRLQALRDSQEPAILRIAI